MGFLEFFFIFDGIWLFEGGMVEGVLLIVNGEFNIDNLKK